VSPIELAAVLAIVVLVASIVSVELGSHPTATVTSYFASVDVR
jgi:hypothetical protein